MLPGCLHACCRVEKMLGSVGVEIKANKVKTVVSELQGKILEFI